MESRAPFYFDEIDWHAILEGARYLRLDDAAEFYAKAFQRGYIYVERYIQFSDKVIWVARVHIPSPWYLAGGKDMLDAKTCMESELATAEFLRELTSIPIQRVYGRSKKTYDGRAPFMFIEWVGATTADDLRRLKNGDESELFGTTKQDRKFRQQMAGIQAELASFMFTKIGSFHPNENTGVAIERELRTGKGPWKNSDHYFEELANHELLACADSGMEKVLSSASFALPSLVRHLMSVYASERGSRYETYHLTDQKFGADNLLVNEDFDIVGFVEWDGIISAPIQQAAQFPRRMGLSRPPPGMLELSKSRFAKRQEYKQMLLIAEQGWTIKITDMLESHSASIFQGLERYRDPKWDWRPSVGASIWPRLPSVLGRQLSDEQYKVINDNWMEAYARLLRLSIQNFVQCDDESDSQSSCSSREIVD